MESNNNESNEARSNPYILNEGTSVFFNFIICFINILFTIGQLSIYIGILCCTNMVCNPNPYPFVKYIVY